MVDKEIEGPETSINSPLIHIHDVRSSDYDVFVNVRQIVAIGSPSVEKHVDPKHPEMSFLSPALETIEMPTGEKLKAYRLILRATNGELYEYVTPFIWDLKPLIEAMSTREYDLAELPGEIPPITMRKEGIAPPPPGFLLLIRPLVRDIYWTMLRADTVVSIKISKDMKSLYNGKKEVKGYEVIISTEANRQYNFYLLSVDEVEWYINHAKTAIAMAYGTEMLAV